MNYIFTGIIENKDDIYWIRIPQDISDHLSSRSMGMGEMTIDKIKSQVPIEPDGEKGHILVLDKELMNKMEDRVGERISVQLRPLTIWTDPNIPTDLKDPLDNTQLLAFWDSLTTKAKWEWIRWIRSTNNQDTRAKRIGVAISKLSKGDRRPCCFNTAMCTIPQISKSGVLIKSDLSDTPDKV